MNLSAPVLDVSPGVRGALLQTLARLAQPVTRRRLAALAGAAPGHATTIITHLVESGLVTETTAGRSSLVALNRAHLAAPAVVELASLRGELVRRLRERLSSWPELHAAWLFGSVARADAGLTSDIDLLVVVADPHSPEHHERLAELDADVLAWTGNELQITEHSPSSWQTLDQTKNPLIDEVRRDGISLVEHADLLLGNHR